MSSVGRQDIGVEGVRSYRDLKVWAKAMELAELVYAVAKQMPSDGNIG